MAAKLSKKDIALPLNYYEEEEQQENWPERLKLFALVFKNIGVTRQNLLIKYQPFIGNVLLNLGIVLDTTIDTAATDFRNVYVNPDFWVLLDDEERRFVLAHETWHVAMNHSLRRQGRIPELWNVACDLEIHFILLTERFKEPWCLQHDPAWAPLSAERIYEELLKNQRPRRGRNPVGPGGQPGGDPGSGNGQPQDGDPGNQNGNQDGSQDQNGNQDGNQDGSQDQNGNQDGNQDGSQDQNGNQDGNQDGSQKGGNGLPDENGKPNDKFGSTNKSFDDVIYDDKKKGGDGSGKGREGNDPNGDQPYGDGYPTGGGDDGRRVIRRGEWKPASEEPERIDDFVKRIVEQAVQITSKKNGTVPGAVAGILDEVKDPVVPWQRQLDDWTTRVTNEWGHNTYKRLSRRTWSCGAILPSTENKSLKVAVALDTSGSCGPELQQFFGELIGIMDSFDEYELTVIQCDSQIQSVETYSNEEPYDPEEGFKVRGFGGTDFRPVFDYIEEHELNPTALIFLTDGEGPAPEEAPEYPVLWVITQGGDRPCEWGEAVSLTNDRVE